MCRKTKKKETKNEPSEGICTYLFCLGGVAAKNKHRSSRSIVKWRKAVDGRKWRRVELREGTGRERKRRGAEMTRGFCLIGWGCLWSGQRIHSCIWRTNELTNELTRCLPLPPSCPRFLFLFLLILIFNIYIIYISYINKINLILFCWKRKEKKFLQILSLFGAFLHLGESFFQQRRLKS